MWGKKGDKEPTGHDKIHGVIPGNTEEDKEKLEKELDNIEFAFTAIKYKTGDVVLLPNVIIGGRTFGLNMNKCFQAAVLLVEELRMQKQTQDYIQTVIAMAKPKEGKIITPGGKVSLDVSKIHT